jgi:hypothetical protein
MYSEDKLINGVLMTRFSPDGEWQRKTTNAALAVNLLTMLSDEQREEVFGYFCTHCGSLDVRCQCWNDE